ncbi:MAG: hypothetical protein KDC12_01540 [Flavobacteriales bacterium]|nr:hypothetical protein [Flavobacteriales bacterium]
MKALRITILLCCTLAATFNLHAQCEFDLNDDGIVTFGAGEILIPMGEFGIYEADLDPGEELQSDFNANGVGDIQDVVDFLAHVGTVACTDTITLQDCLNGLVLQVYEEFPDGFTGTMDNIPPGYVTYRLYADMANEDFHMWGLYGNNESPFELWCDEEIFIHQLGMGGVSNLNPGFFSIAPTLQYSSYFTINFDPVSYDNVFVNTLSSEGNSWLDSLAAGTGFSVNNVVGGGLVSTTYPSEIINATPSNLYYLAQFTVPATANLGGSMSLLFGTSQSNPDGIPVCYNHNLTWGMENLQVLGCTDPSAGNYNPDATYNDGTCSAPGDFNGDGDINTGDVLLFLSSFGCTEDCGGMDLNGDGIVNAVDLLVMLGLL